MPKVKWIAKRNVFDIKKKKHFGIEKTKRYNKNNNIFDWRYKKI
jgi:hypothetical protein